LVSVRDLTFCGRRQAQDMSPSGLFSRVYIPTPHNLTHAYRGVARHTCSYMLRAKPRPCVTPKSCPSSQDKKPRDSFLLSQVTSIQTRERAHEKERDGGTERGKKRHGSLDMQLLRRAVTRREGGISLPAARYTHMQTCTGSLGRFVSRAARGHSLARSRCGVAPRACAVQRAADVCGTLTPVSEQ